MEIARDFSGSDHPMLSDCCSAARVAFVKEQPSNVGKATFYKVSTAPSPWFDKEIAAGKLVFEASIGKHDFYGEARFEKNGNYIHDTHIVLDKENKTK